MFRLHTLAILTALAAAPLQAQVISGPATALDGRTIDMTGTAIRLAHIDAPEAKQSCQRDGAAWACGTEATENLAAIIDNGPVECEIVGSDASGTPLAICHNAVFDLGRELVRRGLALADANAPEEYAAATGIAQDLRYGLWAAEFEQPAAWRAANPKSVLPLARAQSGDPAQRSARTRPAAERRYVNTWGCAIKGNHSQYGGLIYHLPGQRYYNQTRPEALFCTEREAMAAGFRRSKE
jgi:endonuclease YncB( thermonuclease family)